MSTAQTCWIIFGSLLLSACLVISVMTFGRLWFLDRPRLRARLREVLGGAPDAAGPALSFWRGLRAFLAVVLGTLCAITIGIFSLFWVPLVYAWYRLRGRPLPPPNPRFDDEDERVN